MQIVSYGDVVFSQLGVNPGVPWGAGAGQWSVAPQVVTRQGTTPVIGPGVVTPRTIRVQFTIPSTVGGDDLRLVRDRLIGALNPEDRAMKVLRAKRYDGTYVRRSAVVSLPNGFDSNQSANVIVVEFVSDKPAWYAEDTTTHAWIDQTTQRRPLACPNPGQMMVHPIYEIRPNNPTITQHTVDTATVGYKYWRSIIVTNDGDRSLPPNYPYRLSLGDTRAWVNAGHAQADGDDIRILLNGVIQRREIVAPNFEVSFAWVTLPPIPPKQAITYDIYFGNPVAGASPGLINQYRPTFDITWFANAATGGSTTTVDDVAQGWRSDQWKDAVVWICSGPNAGLSRLVSTNINNQITLSSAFPSAVTAGTRYVVTHSHNGKWTYAVRRDQERGADAARGRWYVSSGEAPPDTTLWTTPGSWYRMLYLDNRDKFGQKRWTRDSFGGDPDTYTPLFAERTYELGPQVSEEGIADGVGFSSPIPITNVRNTLKFTNPNGMCKAVIMARDAGADDWQVIAEDSAEHATAFSWDPGSLDLTGTKLHLYMGIIPAVGDEIDLTWKSDQGSTTAAGTTTVATDNTKSWTTNQFKNGQLRFTSGALAGSSRTISSNTATQITVSSAFGAAIPADSSYEIINPKLKGTIEDDNRLVITLDDSTITQTAISAEAEVYQLTATITTGRTDADGDLVEGTRIKIGQSGSLVFLRATDKFRYDSGRRLAAIYDSTDALVRRLPEPHIDVEYIDGDGVTRKSMNGCPIPIGQQQLDNPSAATGILGWSVAISAGMTSAVLTQDAVVYYGAEVGAFKLAVVGSAGGAYADVSTEEFFPVVPGSRPAIVGALRRGNANLNTALGFIWFDEDQVEITRNVSGHISASVGSWDYDGFSWEAPAGTAFCKPFARATCTTAGLSTTFWFDALMFGPPIVWLDETNMGSLALTVSYNAGWLG